MKKRCDHCGKADPSRCWYVSCQAFQPAAPKVSAWTEDALVALLFVIALVAAPLILFSLEREPQPEPVAQPSCPITISQYGPGERWISPSSSSSGCASAAGAVPNHILSKPVEQ